MSQWALWSVCLCDHPILYQYLTPRVGFWKDGGGRKWERCLIGKSALPFFLSFSFFLSFLLSFFLSFFLLSLALSLSLLPSLLPSFLSFFMPMCVCEFWIAQKLKSFPFDGVLGSWNTVNIRRISMGPAWRPFRLLWPKTKFAWWM